MAHTIRRIADRDGSRYADLFPQDPCGFGDVSSNERMLRQALRDDDILRLQDTEEEDEDEDDLDDDDLEDEQEDEDEEVDD